MYRTMITALIFCLAQTVTIAQEDTASVTFIPSLDVYLLQYNMEGMSYTDTLVPATRIYPAVSCDLTYEALTSLRVYSYSVSLEPSSQQYLHSFLVSHPAPIESATKPNVRWSQGEFAQYKVWDWANTTMDSSGLWTPTTDVAPGSSLGGFSFKSTGLPAVVNCYFQGRVRGLAFSAEPPSKMYDLLDPIRVFPNNTVIRRTVGPKDPPTPFIPPTFLDTIASYVNESRTLNWISNQATATKYTALIDSAKSHLQASPTQRGIAKAKLDSVLVNVYPDSSAGLITSEAYALLRFNTEYVLKKLREEDSSYAMQNTSSSWDATATNNARHLAKFESYLHEVFTSGGEIIYRRSTNSGSSWDQTHLINTVVGENSRPCITATKSGSVQIVWQRRVAPSTYQVWHSYSQDNGESWSTPTVLPDADVVGVSNYQTDGTMPVIDELIESGQLVAVYCSQEGFLYQISDDGGENWQGQESISGQYDDRVRYPSLAGGDSYISLVYDYVDDTNSPWSRTFDGTSWSEEESVGKGTDITDAMFSSVAIDGDNNPIAVWTGNSPILAYGRAIVFRSGYSDNTWSSWFTVFGLLHVDLLSPSVAFYKRDGEYGVAIVNHTLQDHIKLITLTSVDPPSWDMSTLDESGAWASITQKTSSSGTPVYCWTDQSTFPHEVVVGSSDAFASSTGRVVRMTTNDGVRHKRRAVVHHRTLRSTLALEFEPVKIVLANGDTTVVPFKTSSLRQRGKINYVTMWDYLGSGIVNVPANARQLIVSKRFGERGVLGERKFSLRVLNNRGISIAVLDTTTTNGTITVNIAPYAGMNVSFSPALSILGIEPSILDVGVGDVFIKSR